MNKFVLSIVFFLNIQIISASNQEPPLPPDAPLPPGSPIDGNIILLFFVALTIGYLFSLKYTFSKKDSI